MPYTSLFSLSFYQYVFLYLVSIVEIVLPQTIQLYHANEWWIPPETRRPEATFGASAVFLVCILPFRMIENFREEADGDALEMDMDNVMENATISPNTPLL